MVQSYEPLTKPFQPKPLMCQNSCKWNLLVLSYTFHHPTSHIPAWKDGKNIADYLNHPISKPYHIPLSMSPLPTLHGELANIWAYNPCPFYYHLKYLLESVQFGPLKEPFTLQTSHVPVRLRRGWGEGGSGGGGGVFRKRMNKMSRLACFVLLSVC